MQCCSRFARHDPFQFPFQIPFPISFQISRIHSYLWCCPRTTKHIRLNSVAPGVFLFIFSAGHKTPVQREICDRPMHFRAIIIYCKIKKKKSCCTLLAWTWHQFAGGPGQLAVNNERGFASCAPHYKGGEYLSLESVVDETRLFIL